MNIIEVKSTRTETQKRIELTRVDIRRLIEKEMNIKLPFEVGIFMQVPGGADWSNTELDVGCDCPVIITWTEVEEHYD